jgi:hypothetical protein
MPENGAWELAATPSFVYTHFTRPAWSTMDQPCLSRGDNKIKVKKYELSTPSVTGGKPFLDSFCYVPTYIFLCF